ncbi:MAG: hypothetical protein Q7S07_05845, partial [Candidatus Omnitrophota bacterium]|nr:hypothetical protein [Candidatus Omnitrophota bacterium]
MKLLLRNKTALYISSLFYLTTTFAAVSAGGPALAQEEAREELDLKKVEKDFIVSGKQYYISKNYKLAIREWEEALSINPSNEEVRRHIKDAKHMLERPAVESPSLDRAEAQEKFQEEALGEVREELDLKRLEKDFIESGKRYYRSKNYKLAIREWEEALSINPANKEAKRRIGDAKRRLEKTSEKEEGLISVARPPEKDSMVLSLDTCIKIAIENSLPLQIARKNTKLADMRVWEARRNI